MYGMNARHTGVVGRSFRGGVQITTRATRGVIYSDGGPFLLFTKEAKVFPLAPTWRFIERFKKPDRTPASPHKTAVTRTTTTTTPAHHWTIAHTHTSRTARPGRRAIFLLFQPRGDGGGVALQSRRARPNRLGSLGHGAFRAFNLLGTGGGVIYSHQPRIFFTRL